MPVPSWLGSAVAAGGELIGGLFHNQTARRQAEKNRAFQERMSSTAAQRAVEDYRKAGLNPALAYDRPASSPGGSVAEVENVGAKVVSSAMAAAQLRANVELTKAQTDKVWTEAELAKTELSVREVTRGGEPTWREAQIAERVARLRDLAHQGALQPHDERLRALQVLMQREALKRGEFIGESFGDAEAVRDFIKRGFSSAGEARRALDAWAAALRSKVKPNFVGGPRMKFREGPPKRSGGF